MSRQLQRRCKRLVDQLDLPQPFSLDALLGRMEHRRGRPITLLPMPHDVTHSTPCGLWVATAYADYIFHEDETTPLHQEHIIAHELAHMLCADDTRVANEPFDLSELLPNLDPELVKRTLTRSDYTDEEERQAEMIATLIIEHSTKAAVAAGPGFMGRLENVLGTRPHRLPRDGH